MTLAYEYRLLFTYAANLARRIRYPSDRADKLMKEVVLGKSFAELREVVEPSQPLFKIFSRLSELPCLDVVRNGDDRWQKFCGRSMNWNRPPGASRQTCPRAGFTYLANFSN